MSNSNNIDNLTISDLFDKGWQFQEELENSDDTSTSEYKSKLNKAIEHLERSDSLLDELALFSDNESLDEVSTKELRYFLNSALLAWLFTKSDFKSKEIRLVNLEKSKMFYIKFFQLTKNYELHNYRIPKESTLNDDPPHPSSSTDTEKDLLNAAQERNEKIKRYKEQKEIESKLKALRVSCKSENVDEEVQRNFYLQAIRFWLNRSIDDLKLLFDELRLLKSGDLSNEASSRAAAKPKVAPIQPYVITKDALQAKVFGAGYPSLPVYSIEQFYDQLAEKGMMPKAGEVAAAKGHHNEPTEPVQIGGGVTDKQKEDEKAEKDILEDKHDDEELRRQREWDEFKDDNKRGSGNRYNRS